MMRVYRFLLRFLGPIVRKLYRTRVEGLENLPEGGAIFASNHTAFSDVILLTAAVRRPIRYMAKQELFHTPLLPFLRMLGTIPVNRNGIDVSSLKRTIAAIENGDTVGIFPQGHRYGKQDPRNTELKSGIGFLAYHTKADIVPCALVNRELKTRLFRVNRVVIGKPISYESFGFTESGKQDYLAAASFVFGQVCDLVDATLKEEKTEE